MVIGLDKFKSWFADFPDQYIIIGGSACDETISEAGFIPRATKDIDMILIVEVLSSEFVTRFWEFVREAKYTKTEQEQERRNAYRFKDPIDKTFPKQVELFCRKPDALQVPEDIRITPIPTEEGLSSLSAILLDDDYYHFTLAHSDLLDNGIHYANVETLICLKAYAYLNNLKRREMGENIHSENIEKHRKDVFRLLPLLPPASSFEIPTSIKEDLQNFADKVKDNLPEQRMLHDAGYGNLEPQTLYQAMLKIFNLHP